MFIGYDIITRSPRCYSKIPDSRRDIDRFSAAKIIRLREEARCPLIRKYLAQINRMQQIKPIYPTGKVLLQCIILKLEQMKKWLQIMAAIMAAVGGASNGLRIRSIKRLGQTPRSGV